MNVVTVTEYDRLGINTSGYADSITAREADVLDLLSVSSGGGRIIQWQGPNVVQVCQYVGVVQIAHRTLEILPKIHKKQRVLPQCRDYLLRMLKESQTLPAALDQLTWQSTQSWSLLDVIIYAFAVEVRKQLHRGHVHRYEQVTEERTSIRGKLLVSQHARRDPARQLSFPCRFSAFTMNTPLNQVLRTAARVAWRLTENQLVRQSLLWIDAQLDEVDLLSPPYPNSLPALVFDRTTVRYQRACTLAEQILRSQAPSMSAGSASYTSLLFDMNVLFESWFAKRLQHSLKGRATVDAQVTDAWLFQSSTRNVFALRPDIVVTPHASDKGITIIDTKWKLLDETDTVTYGISQADAYQMYAYQQRYDAARVILCYPHHDGLKQPPGFQTSFQAFGTSGRTLEIWTVDVEQGTVFDLF